MRKEDVPRINGKGPAFVLKRRSISWRRVLVEIPGVYREVQHVTLHRPDSLAVWRGSSLFKRNGGAM